jgi:hypothetical protein
MKTIYCDESGFTGYNLLDPAQPVFAVASACVEEAVALDLLKSSFPKYKGTEFKFSNLWRGGNRPSLITFAEAVAKMEHCSFAYYIDKKFGVLSKAVDLLIEPHLHEAGYDFYSDGFNRKYSNYIHFGLTQVGDPAVYDALTEHYLRFSRDPTKDSLGCLQFQLSLMANSLDGPVQSFFEQMSLGADLFEKYHSLDEFKKTNDLQTTSMLAVVGHWRQRFPDDLAMIHDASSNFLRSKEAWEMITSVQAEAKAFVMSDGTVVEFPMRLLSTTAADSKTNPSIQFCDVLAGLVTKLHDPRLEGEDVEFMNDVVAAGLDTVSSNGIWPATIFPDQIPPRRLQGPDLIDQMRVVMFRGR